MVEEEWISDISNQISGGGDRRPGGGVLWARQTQTSGSKEVRKELRPLSLTRRLSWCGHGAQKSCAPCKAPYCYGLEVVAGLAAGLAEGLEVEAVPPTMVADVMVSSLGHLAAMYFSPPFSMAS